ncbi:3,4-dihydroxy-2-butanone 4-phosphate synthase [Sphingobium sp. SYK-6]|nr:3,4-dihydroxy-2-butanone 4-phosphate synthase [Sphingobium sp. SYK-6]
MRHDPCLHPVPDMLEYGVSASGFIPEQPLADIPALLAEARAGRPFILVDDEDRENEGDVVIPASFATASVVNFMARHARGLICLAVAPGIARRLRLEPMVRANGSVHGTAFTVSIEAARGVTTGISAHDRAHSIATAIAPDAVPADIVSPGHVFPLIARPGGVLERPGHTEAAVDIAAMAGLIPAGVICEIMNEDGTMARLPDLRRFARRHGMLIGAINDLAAWRRKSQEA